MCTDNLLRITAVGFILDYELDTVLRPDFFEKSKIALLSGRGALHIHADGCTGKKPGKIDGTVCFNIDDESRVC